MPVDEFGKSEEKPYRELFSKVVVIENVSFRISFEWKVISVRDPAIVWNTSSFASNASPLSASTQYKHSVADAKQKCTYAINNLWCYGNGRLGIAKESEPLSFDFSFGLEKRGEKNEINNIISRMNWR